MINEERMKNLFMKLVVFDSESYSENEIAKYVINKLKKLGLVVESENTTDHCFLKAHPESHPNIYAFLKGNVPGDPILFSAHLDTVAPGEGKKAIITEDGFIVSEGDTVLGADDISGVSSIIEALSVIKEKKLDHPDIEILFTVAEEPFCEGSRHFFFNRIKAKTGYVLDLGGAIGRSAICAPSIFSFEAEITGKASHAGFAPEEGINALMIAVDAMSQIKIGRVDKYTTVNVGTIEGGMARNIVPEKIKLSGEVRSLEHDRAVKQINQIKEELKRCAKKAGASVKFSDTEHIRAYQVSENEKVVARFMKATKNVGIESELVSTLGGSDANRLNENGITTIVNSCGMEKVHSTDEYVFLQDLYRSAELTLNLMTMKE